MTEYVDTSEKLKRMARKTSQMMQSDANALLYQEEVLLYRCVAILYDLLHDYTASYFAKVGYSILLGRRKLTYDEVSDDDVLRLVCCGSCKDGDELASLLCRIRVYRGLTYLFVARLVTDLERYTEEGTEELRKKYCVCELPVGELMGVTRMFETARKLQEEVERAYFRKVIALSLSLSCNNPNVAEDNFMLGTIGLRKAIWRFNYMNGGVLASYIDMLVRSEMSATSDFCPVSVPDSVSNNVSAFRKLRSEGLSLEEAADKLKIAVSTAREVEAYTDRESDFRIDVAADSGIEDRESGLPEELTYEFRRDGISRSVKTLLSSCDRLTKQVVCLSYGMYELLLDDESGVNDADVSAEVARQAT